MPADRVFVTGGRGFVGNVVVRQLLAAGTRVSMLTRSRQALAPELAGRVEVIEGDIRAREAIARALEGCDAVVHCAKSDDPDPTRRVGIDLEGTTAVFAAARHARVRRFVHVSTISVYPTLPRGPIDEDTPYGDSLDLYSVDKRACEAAVLIAQGDCEVVVLQPANIYGPGGSWWTSVLLELMRKGRVILVDGGEGVANLVHVEDVATAATLAVAGRGEPGGRYLLTDGHPRPWREYFTVLERLVGRPATAVMSVSEAKRYSHRVRTMSSLGRVANALARAASRQRPIFPMDDHAIDRFASRAVFVIDRARRELGYQPRITDIAI